MLGLEDDLPEDAVDEILTGVVKKQVDAGDPAAAKLLTYRRGDEHALAHLAAGTAAAGDVARAAALLEEIGTPLLREAATPAVVRALCRVGARATTRALADALSTPEHRGKALVALAQSLGPGPRGRLVLVEALCWGPGEQMTEEITDVVPEHLPLLADLALTEGQPGSAPKITSAVPISSSPPTRCPASALLASRRSRGRPATSRGDRVPRLPPRTDVQQGRILLRLRGAVTRGRRTCSHWSPRIRP
ncbi:hypothetical protein [Streptomyces sp. NRRL B-3648]|uniref:hypothetical protein n=1 Tax=Streptomyces sp. NRRL B-3648 TaxID=1519493 RepID=UPI0006AF98C9|nr:hypothetical protein [Streptomyces sp. NRRL B-3648]